MIGDCPAMQAVFERISRVAPVAMPVLIEGEAGTGKELTARAIHDLGPRAHGPFISLNCAAVPDVAMGAELFGVEQGALPGEDERRRGRADATPVPFVRSGHACMWVWVWVIIYCVRRQESEQRLG